MHFISLCLIVYIHFYINGNLILYFLKFGKLPLTLQSGPLFDPSLGSQSVQQYLHPPCLLSSSQVQRMHQQGFSVEIWIINLRIFKTHFRLRKIIEPISRPTHFKDTALKLKILLSLHSILTSFISDL